MKIKEELLNILDNLQSYNDQEDLEKDISTVLSRQEKIWRFLFSRKEDNKCRTIIKTFFDGIDSLHKIILKQLLINWDSCTILLANKPLFFVVEILEKYSEEIKNYSSGIRRLLLLFWGRELATYERYLKDSSNT